MSEWDATIDRITRTTRAKEDGTQVAQSDSVQAVIAELKTICTARGVGGVFAVSDVGQYEVTIAATHAARAAEVPEQVFVAGLADHSNLGIYVLDPANRWRPGDLDEESAWRNRPTLSIELINANTGADVNDPYLDFDPQTCKLAYSGQDSPTTRLYDVQMRIDGTLGPVFRIRIQRPTFSFGDSSYETITGITGVPHVMPQNAGLGQAIAQRFPETSPDNLVLLTPSIAAADRYYVATINKFRDGLASCYFIGLPGKTKIGRKGEKFTNCIVKRCGTVMWKDLDITANWKLGAEDCTTHVVDQVRITDLNAADAIMFDNTTAWMPADIRQYAWIVNAEFTRCGQSGNKHPVYVHLRDVPLGSRSGADATTHFNNVWSYGNNSAQTVNGVGPQGGCNLKCLSKFFTLRNSNLEQTDNWNDPANGFTSSQLTSFHAHQRGPVYNNVLKWFNTTVQNFGQDKGLFFQNRNLADSGHDDPRYFNQDPGQPAIPPFQPRSIEFTADPATNLCKFAKKFSIMDAVTVASSGKLPRPLNSGTVYYLMNQNNSATRLSLSVNQQQSIDLEDTGTGVHTMTGVPTNLTFNQDYHGSNTYTENVAHTDAPYWTKVNAKPISDPENEYGYHKFVSYNTFELVQLPLDNQLVSSAIFTQGNPPCCPTRQFDPEQNYYSVPKNWVEREQVFLANNVYVGFAGGGNKVVRWNGSTPPTIGIKYPHCVDPLKPRPDPIVVGGERDEGDPIVDVAIPSWFEI